MKNASGVSKDYAMFVRAALERAEAVLARIEAGGDALAIEKWRRVVTSLEGEAARATTGRLSHAA